MPKNLTPLNFFIYNTHILLHPCELTRGCTTTELKMCYNVEPLKLKLRLSQQSFRSKPHPSVASTHAKAKLKLRQALQMTCYCRQLTTIYLKEIHFCEN